MKRIKFSTALYSLFSCVFIVSCIGILTLAQGFFLPHYELSLMQSRRQLSEAIRDLVADQIVRGNSRLVERALARTIGVEGIENVRVVEDNVGNNSIENISPDRAILTIPVYLNQSKSISVGSVEFSFSRLAEKKARTGVFIASGILLGCIIIAFLGILIIGRRLFIRPLQAISSDLYLRPGRQLESRNLRLLEFFEFADVYNANLQKIEMLSFENAKNERLAAIAKTTTMLAHDVRKPLTMIKMLAETIDSIEDPDEMREFVIQCSQEIQSAVENVNGLLADIMEASNTGELRTAPVWPEEIIASTIIEIQKLNPSSNVRFEYDFLHTRRVQIDVRKVLRVFSNIVGNAFQAMYGNGKMWFFTEEEVNSQGNLFIKFTIGNSGSFIPKSDIPNLFEAFFTKGKTNGTGLGLAIAHKIVTSHSGRIWCDSSPDKGVEFYFTLPASFELQTPPRISLPTQSSDLAVTIPNFRPA